MAKQYATALRNALLDAYETTIGTGPTLEIRSGAQPANCAAADSGTLLASLALPSDWMANASAGAKGLLGTWSDPSSDASGTAGHYRLKNGGTCWDQGTITATGGGGDMTLASTSITATQPFTVTAFDVLMGGA